MAEAKAIEPDLARAEELLPPAEELARRIKNVRLVRGNRAATLVHGALSTARKRAKRDREAAEVLGVLEDLSSYMAKPVERAKATRAKKGKGKKAPAPASNTGTGNGPAPA